MEVKAAAVSVAERHPLEESLRPEGEEPRSQCRVAGARRA